METLITQKTALLAKEKNFNVLCESYFSEHESGVQENNNYGFRNWNKEYKNSYSRPSQSVLADWLLDNYKLHINICALGLKKWSFMLEELSIDGTLCKGGDLGIQNYSSKQEAFERGLFDALSLIDHIV